MVVVTTSRVNVRGTNLNRRYLLFVNTHTANITVYFAGSAHGITIPPSLGAWEIPTPTFQSVNPTHEFFGTIEAVSASGSGDLQIVEG